MEEVLVEEWSRFFQAAGLNKTAQVKYTKAFTDNDVGMQSFCEMVTQHTESGIHFMKSLGVQPAGHQIKISMKAQKYRNTPQGCSRVKIEQIGITPTRQSNIKLEPNEIIEFTSSSNKKSTGKNPLTIDSLYHSSGHQYPSSPSSSGYSTLEPPGHLQPQVHLRFQDVSVPGNSPTVNSAKQSNNNSKIDKFETSQKRLGTTKLGRHVPLPSTPPTPSLTVPANISLPDRHAHQLVQITGKDKSDAQTMVTGVEECHTANAATKYKAEKESFVVDHKISAQFQRDKNVEKIRKAIKKDTKVPLAEPRGGNESGLLVIKKKEKQKPTNVVQDAVKDLDCKSWLGARVRLEHARDSRDRIGSGGVEGGGGGDGGGEGGRGRSPQGRRGNPPGRRTGYRLIVENLSSRTSWQDLKDYMRQAGEINYTSHIRSGEGVVEFGYRSDMEYALDKLDGTELDGRKIKLTEESKRSRSRSRDRSRERERSRSRDRSRSRSRSRSHRTNVPIVEVEPMAKDEPSVKVKSNKRKREEVSEGCKLIVKGIIKVVDERILLAALEAYGTVTAVDNPGNGHVYVIFSNPAQAKAAKEALEGTEVAGCHLTLSAASPRVATVIAKNVGKDTSISKIKAAFAMYGTIKHAYSDCDGDAFVLFKSAKDAQKAVDGMNGKELGGRKLQCFFEPGCVLRSKRKKIRLG